jgi:fumarate hydratase class II
MITNLLDSIQLLTSGVKSFVKNCLLDIKANKKHIKSQLDRLLMLVTNLVPKIGYDKCSTIAIKAFDENKSIKDVVKEMGIEFDEDLDELLDPKKMV